MQVKRGRGLERRVKMSKGWRFWLMVILVLLLAACGQAELNNPDLEEEVTGLYHCPVVKAGDTGVGKVFVKAVQSKVYYKLNARKSDSSSLAAARKLRETSFHNFDWDGVFGNGTYQAVKKFQMIAFPDKWWEWDGIVGDKTWAALGGCP